MNYKKAAAVLFDNKTTVKHLLMAEKLGSLTV